MHAGSSLTARTLSDAVNRRAERAFGTRAQDSVAVTDIDNHNTDVEYRITTRYSLEAISRAVRVDTGVLSTDGLQAALQARRDVLMSNPAQMFGQVLIEQLKARPARIMKPARFCIASDDRFYCNWQACPDCGTHGQVHCPDCHGRGMSGCTACHGSGQQHCTHCNATGWAGGPRHCGHCSGSGTYLGQACNACSGRGTNAYPCPACYNSGKVGCSACHGSAELACRRCTGGVVTCGTCAGDGQFVHEWHFDIYAETSITYHWSAAQPWLHEALAAAVNDEDAYPSVFHVTSLSATGDDPASLTGKGYANAATATVIYQGRRATCRFIGAAATPVDLGGVLSGNFTQVLQQMEQPARLRTVRQAARNKVAATLIEEVERQGRASQASTPVRSGIISLEQAERFVALREQTARHLDSYRDTLKVRPVMRLALSIFKWLSLFYLVVNLLGHTGPGATQGVMALLREPGQVLGGLLKHYAIALHYGGWTLWTFLIVSALAGARVVPRLWPAIDRLPDNLWVRIPAMTLAGSLLLSVLLALAPMTQFHFNPPGWIPDAARFRQSIAGTLSMLPAIFVTSMAIAVVRYRQASRRWINRQRQRLGF